MRNKITILFTLITIIANSQEIDLNTFSPNKDIEVCIEIKNKMKSSNSIVGFESYDKIIDKIIETVGLKKNFKLIECNNIQNAVAYTRPEKSEWVRYIAYDKAFMDGIEKNSNDWSKVGILAHEIGHHLNFHNLSVTRDLAESRKKELEADEFAGFILQKLGATLKESQLFFKVMTTDSDDTFSTHPKRSRRLKAIEIGYNRARKGYSNTPNNKPEKKTNSPEKDDSKIEKESDIIVKRIPRRIPRIEIYKKEDSLLKSTGINVFKIKTAMKNPMIARSNYHKVPFSIRGEVFEIKEYKRRMGGNKYKIQLTIKDPIKNIPMKNGVVGTLWVLLPSDKNIKNGYLQVGNDYVFNGKGYVDGNYFFFLVESIQK